MAENDLNEYLESLIRQNGGLPESEMLVFKKLVELTIKFRDQQHSETGQVLTIRETQAAIAVYSEALRVRRMPKKLDETIDRLVKLWLKEINNVVYEDD